MALAIGAVLARILTGRGPVVVVIAGGRLVLVLPCGMFVSVHDQLGRRDPGPQHLPGVNVCLAEGKTAERPLQIGDRQTGVDERTERHIARNP
jgi:hypothetical protein